MMVDGKKIALAIKNKLISHSNKNTEPLELHIVYVGSDPVIDAFIRFKERFGHDVGVNVIVHRFDEDVLEEALIEHIRLIAQKPVGIIVQLPLPRLLDTEAILSAVPPQCDIDVLGTHARALFSQGKTTFFPPVTGAIVHIMQSHNLSFHGKNIVLVGKGQLVGYPTSLWFEKEGYSYAVIDGDTSSSEKQALLTQADVIISGVGQPGIIQPDMIKEGVVLFDAGTSESNKKIVGDIAPECYEKASLVTPVPGGIGPITIAVLYENLFKIQNIYDA